MGDIEFSVFSRHAVPGFRSFVYHGGVRIGSQYPASQMGGHAPVGIVALSMLGL